MSRVARDGQHWESETNDSRNVTPSPAISARVRGIDSRSATVWSSVSITTTFGAARADPGSARASAARMDRSPHRLANALTIL